jgi:hypothetical protein
MASASACRQWRRRAGGRVLLCATSGSRRLMAATIAMRVSSSAQDLRGQTVTSFRCIARNRRSASNSSRQVTVFHSTPAPNVLPANIRSVRHDAPPVASAETVLSDQGTPEVGHTALHLGTARVAGEYRRLVVRTCNPAALRKGNGYEALLVLSEPDIGRTEQLARVLRRTNRAEADAARGDARQ